MKYLNGVRFIGVKDLGDGLVRVEYEDEEGDRQIMDANLLIMNGKFILVGDALAGLRPHTTAGASQAAMHAMLLKRVFEKDESLGIDEWESKVLEWATAAR